MTGTVNETFGSELNYQVSMLIVIEQEAQKKNSNQEFANVLTQSLDDLTKIQAQLKKLTGASSNTNTGQ